jgi:hypothetical protein
MVQEMIHEILMGHSDSDTIYQILHGINESLQHEHIHSLPLVSNTILHIPETITPVLPPGTKSLGLAVGPIVLTLLLPTPDNYAHVKTVRNFFENFLNAKQVLDDAHDWYEDISVGKVTWVTKKILEQARTVKNTISIVTDKLLLQEIFWNTVFDEVVQDINHWLAYAESEIEHLSFLANTEFLRDMITDYKQIVEQAISERTTLNQFLRSYKKTTITGGL